MSITTDNRAVVLRLYEALNTRDEAEIAGALGEVFHPDVVVHTPLPTSAPGVEGLKGGFAMLLRAFPDLGLVVQNTIADGDKVVVHNGVSGTHRGEHFGIAPTGKPFAIEEIMIYRLRDGRIAEVRGVVDMYGQLQQLGVLER